MSVLIKGMEIPGTCLHCPFADGEYGWCDCDNDIDVCFDERPDACPLIALPDHHGRLMDADALCEDLLGRWSVAETRKEDLIKAVMADVVTPIIACQPIIVEAEGDE